MHAFSLRGNFAAAPAISSVQVFLAETTYYCLSIYLFIKRSGSSLSTGIISLENLAILFVLRMKITEFRDTHRPSCRFPL